MDDWTEQLMQEDEDRQENIRLADQKAKKDKRDALRNTFSTVEGKRALALMLAEMGFFASDLKTPEDVALRNYASKLFHNLGFADTDVKIMYFIEKCFEIPQ